MIGNEISPLKLAVVEGINSNKEDSSYPYNEEEEDSLSLDSPNVISKPQYKPYESKARKNKEKASASDKKKSSEKNSSI